MNLADSLSRLIRHPWWSGLAIAVVAVVSSIPALNNGFMSDDYVHLEWAEQLLSHPSHLFGTPPIGFRPTSFLAYLALKKLFGFASPFHYLFTILIHVLSCLLVRQLARNLFQKESVAWSAALFFAVVYQSQEVVYYIAAVNESLMVLFSLSALVMWLRRKYFLTLVAYCLALLSKESAIVLPLLALLIEYGILASRTLQPIRWLVLIVPAAARLGFLVYFGSQNSM